jgi:hypothetical protein
MAHTGGGIRAASAGVLAAIALAATGMVPALAADKHHKARILTGTTAGQIAVEMVYFADPTQRPVRLLRGVPGPTPAVIRRPVSPIRPQRIPQRPQSAQPQSTQPQSTQIVSFGTGFAEQVTVVRGGSFTVGGAAHPPDSPGFVSRQPAAVTVLRGAAVRELFSIDLFGPADAGELDRIAFAVEGIESRHGADPRMWRPSLTGPQGPMQVSAAAAFDVGGGDRFDIGQNRLLGHAYLAQMYRRYGNWADAIAAYNWGPGNIDLWIAQGRNTDLLPFDVARYVALVLRAALVTARR